MNLWARCVTLDALAIAAAVAGSLHYGIACIILLSAFVLGTAWTLAELLNAPS